MPAPTAAPDTRTAPLPPAAPAVPALECSASRYRAAAGRALPADLQGFTKNAWGFAAVMQEWLTLCPAAPEPSALLPEDASRAA